MTSIVIPEYERLFTYITHRDYESLSFELHSFNLKFSPTRTKNEITTSTPRSNPDLFQTETGATLDENHIFENFSSTFLLSTLFRYHSPIHGYNLLSYAISQYDIHAIYRLLEAGAVDSPTPLLQPHNSPTPHTI
jgi:hypothetical protein